MKFKAYLGYPVSESISIKRAVNAGSAIPTHHMDI